MYKIETTKQFDNSFKKIDKTNQIEINKFIEKIEKVEDPTTLGKPLLEDMKDIWRYRIGKYRLFALIKKNQLYILFIDIQHRAKSYLQATKNKIKKIINKNLP